MKGQTNPPLNNQVYGAPQQNFNNNYYPYSGQMPNQYQLMNNNNFNTAPMFQPNFSNQYPSSNISGKFEPYNQSYATTFQPQPQKTQNEISPEISLKIHEIQADHEQIQNDLDEDSALLDHLNLEFDILMRKINDLSSQGQEYPDY